VNRSATTTRRARRRTPATAAGDPQSRYHAGLDGLRALAVLGVLLYHGGVSWAGGGFLGVEAFFVLSGFLITSLLVVEWKRSHTIALGAFWARRARRLLPALFLMVAAVGVYYAVAGPMDTVPDLKGAGISTLLYAGNWHQISTGASYFAASGPTSPLKHTWSLAIEEQFYLFWPLLLVGVFWLVRRRQPRRFRESGGALRLLLAVSVVGAVASAIDTALLFNGGKGLDRVYYGTDTRAGSLLAGAALALGLALLQQRLQHLELSERSRERGRALSIAAAIGLLTVLVAMHFADSDSAWLYPFGLLGVDIAVALVIIAVVLAPHVFVGRLLSTRPLRAIGQISYGLYLWHFPLFLWLDASSTGTSGPVLLGLRIAVTLIVSVLSFFLLEQPIRKRTIPTPMVRSLAPLAAGGALIALVIASAIQAPGFKATAAPSPPPSTAKFTGTAPGCTVTLKDTPQYGLAPLPRDKATSDIYAWLGAHKVGWQGSASETFHTCPPKKVMVVGDSLAFTLGVGMMDDETHYGVEVANAGILGCAFTTAGQLDVGGVWQDQSAGCPTALEQWSREEQQLGASAVIVELGYRDQFDWKINGKVVHLGQPAFDRDVQQQIDRYVSVLGANGAKVVFLSVPYTSPPANADGSPAPAASPARHRLINQMLQNAARAHDNVRVVDIDKKVSPAGHYQAKIDGQVCRFDGIHFSVFCSKLLQPDILTATRKLIGG
jgi:peptidoglycan/LPS O-acetylase OafA/YrhL